MLLLLTVINLFTALSVVNTLSMATAGRRREFAPLLPAGAQSAQVLRMPAWEAVLTCAVALLPAAVVCGSVLVPLGIALTGSAVPALPGGPLAALMAGALVLTVGTPSSSPVSWHCGAPRAHLGDRRGPFPDHTVPGRHFPHPRRTRDHGR
ncbi:FtsX-like permease family protein [Streptomyces iakyrus]|uniref:FtsX-like permease family protein n=1 Tax=Streptomyces iakyrus TaxID=68219 RepID=UPI0036FAF6A8